MCKSRPLLCWFAAAVLLVARVGLAVPFDTHAEQAVLERQLPHQAQQFELGSLPSANGHERFRITAANGHIRVEGSTPSALLFGVNWYLKYVAHVQISPN